MRDRPVPRVPDDWSIWAFSDVHGVTSALEAGLREAGVVDSQLHWSAPARTALIGCGDYVDGGSDSRGMVAFLERLAGEAAQAGGQVLLARGNHEAMMLSIRDGAHEFMDPWLRYGGDATLRSYGCPALGVHDAARLGTTLDECAPGLFAWLEALPQAVVWRDVCFVHGGLPPGYHVDELGQLTDEHLWIRADFFGRAWEASEFEGYRYDGIERVVFGHTPQPDGVRFFHGGRSIDIDSNAVGGTRLPPGSRQELTLLHLAGDEPFDQARQVRIDTTGAPEALPRLGSGGPGRGTADPP